MKAATKTYPRLFAAFTLALAISSFAVARPTAPVDARTTEANVARITTSLLAQSQLSHHPLDTQLAGKLLDHYLDALDGTRSLFLKSDVAEFGAMRATLAQSTRADGDTRPAHVIFARYVERLKQKVAFDTALLKAGGFTFTGHDTFAFDREHAERPADLAAAHELWKQALRAEVLQERLAEKPVPDVAATLIHRHEQQMRTVSTLGDDEVLEIYLDALAHVYDPHSDYMGKESMDSLSIAMNLSLFGIGATLANEDGVCTIHELVPGGPAALSGELKAGDRIVAVAQATGATVDVTRHAADADRSADPRAQGDAGDADHPAARRRARWRANGAPGAGRGPARGPAGQGAHHRPAPAKRDAFARGRDRPAVVLLG